MEVPENVHKAVSSSSTQTCLLLKLYICLAQGSTYQAQGQGSPISVEKGQECFPFNPVSDNIQML